jgi:hypothetical protein
MMPGGMPDDEHGVAVCPIDRLARRFMDRILVTDPTVKGLWPDQSRSRFLSSRWTLERRGKFFEKLLVIDLAARDSLLEAHCGECTRAAEYLIAINQDIIDRLLDVVRFRSAR